MESDLRDSLRREANSSVFAEEVARCVGLMRELAPYAAAAQWEAEQKDDRYLLENLPQDHPQRMALEAHLAVDWPATVEKALAQDHPQALKVALDELAGRRCDAAPEIEAAPSSKTAKPHIVAKWTKWIAEGKWQPRWIRRDELEASIVEQVTERRSRLRAYKDTGGRITNESVGLILKPDSRDPETIVLRWQNCDPDYESYNSTIRTKVFGQKS
jgi:hypothetical protein